MGNLVITRKFGEKVRIGADTIVQIVGIKGGKVRLAILSPKLRILREEVFQRLEDAGEVAETIWGTVPLSGDKEVSDAQPRIQTPAGAIPSASEATGVVGQNPRPGNGRRAP